MLKIRPATVNDVTDIVHIHITSWKAQFTSFLTDEQVKLKDLDEQSQFAIWQRRLSDEENISRKTFIAEKDEAPVGYITGRDYRLNAVELHQIYVLPESSHSGIGKKLVAQLAQHALENDKQTMVVFVMTINPAIAFYRSLPYWKWLAERIIPEGDGILKESLYVWSDLETLALLS